ncbi:MAG TPA: hypothetical protein VI461_00270 [Chitinophagaceae bacterium]|nr:hypothetical protein [Chitinophagaceae bacterium]
MQPPPIPNQAPVKCQWCSKPINNDAIRCNSCGKLRKDIYEDKVKTYVLCILGGLLIGIAVAFLAKGRQGEWLLAPGILIGIAGIYFYSRVSQKMKTWWWM